MPQRLAAAVLLLGLPAAAAMAQPVRVVDLRDAYPRATALAGLLGQVDAELARVRAEHGSRLEAIDDDLAALETSRMHEDEKRRQRIALLRERQALRARVAQQEQAVGEAQQRAVDEVEAAIAVIERELSEEAGGAVVLRAAELLWWRPDRPFDATEALYQRLNARLPAVRLKLAR